jgi:CheY-like chemotaxis protein
MEATDARKTILLVDDDVDYLAQTQLQLEAAGYRVVTADGPKEALAALENLRPDVAIFDLMMEHLDDGFVLAHKVKRMDASTPVILVTAVTSETGFEFDTATEEERSWIEADAVLDKPVRIEQLTREIERLTKG